MRRHAIPRTAQFAPAPEIMFAVAGHLPNLLIVGAAKSGTTSLHAYLDRHPAISMSKKKELQLFSGDDWEERLGWYREQFPVRAPVRGESSPAYSMDPVLPHVPARARKVVPGARIVYMVRDPVERLLAHYVEFVTILREKRSFEEAMADYDAPSNVYVMTSRYAHQLDRWREHFPDSQILVVEQRELLDDRRAAMRRLFRFLDVDDSYWTPDFDRLHNTRERKLLVNERGLWMYKKGLYDPTLRLARRLPAALSRGLVGFMGDEVERPVPTPALRDELVACLREDVRRLREYTGREFDHWSV
jgi:sulfotransferase family protein